MATSKTSSWRWFRRIRGPFCRLGLFWKCPFRDLTSPRTVSYHFIDTADCTMKQFCCCSEFSLYISLALPPKRGWERRGIFLSESLDSSVRILEVLITASFLIYVSSAAISTDKPAEWCIDLARAWRNLARCAEPISPDDKDWMAAEENKSAWEFIATRLLTCFSMVSRFLDDMVTGEGFERSKLDTSESKFGKDVESVSL